MTSDTMPLTGLHPTRAEIARLCAEGQPVTLVICDLEALDLSDLDLTGWCFDRCNLKRASFNRAVLEGTSFKGCRAADSSFNGAAMLEGTIDGGDFSNTSFRGARLAEVSILRCKMTGADLTDVQAMDLVLEEVLLVLAVLPKLSFRKMTLKQVDFSEADLRACDFRDAVFEECSLRDAHLADCRFENADLRGADLGGVKLTDARRFKGAVISRRQAADLLGQLGLRVL